MTTAVLAEALDKATISPYKEAIAFEYLYSREGMTLSELANLTVHSTSRAMASYIFWLTGKRYLPRVG